MKKLLVLVSLFTSFVLAGCDKAEVISGGGGVATAAVAVIVNGYTMNGLGSTQPDPATSGNRTLIHAISHGNALTTYTSAKYEFIDVATGAVLQTVTQFFGSTNVDFGFAQTTQASGIVSTEFTYGYVIPNTFRGKTIQYRITLVTNASSNSPYTFRAFGVNP